MDIRWYNEETDFEGVTKLLKEDGRYDEEITADEIAGHGLVAEMDGEIVAFSWVLVGLSSNVYWDYLLIKKTLPDKWDVLIDLCGQFLKILEEAKVKNIIAGIQNPKLVQFLSKIGFKQCGENVLMKGNVRSICEGLRGGSDEQRIVANAGN